MWLRKHVRFCISIPLLLCVERAVKHETISFEVPNFFKCRSQYGSQFLVTVKTVAKERCQGETSKQFEFFENSTCTCYSGASSSKLELENSFNSLLNRHHCAQLICANISVSEYLLQLRLRFNQLLFLLILIMVKLNDIVIFNLLMSIMCTYSILNYKIC